LWPEKKRERIGDVPEIADPTDVEFEDNRQDRHHDDRDERRGHRFGDTGQQVNNREGTRDHDIHRETGAIELG